MIRAFQPSPSYSKMSIFKKPEPLEVNKDVVHDIRKALRPEHEHLREGMVDMETRLNEELTILRAMRTELYNYITSVDKLLEKLEG